MVKENSEALEALEFAMNFEEDGHKFYLEASKKTDNALGKEMFKSLAEEETRHIKMVKAIYENLNKVKEWPKSPDGKKKEEKHLDFETIFTRVKDDIKETLEVNPDDTEALRVAKEMEIEGYKFYQKRAKKTKDPLEKEFYQMLEKEESNHYEVINNTYEYLSNPSDWFSKKERPIYEG